jgi:hypothetical protein
MINAVITIKSETDIHLLDASGDYHLEVYLHECIIPIQHLNGSLKVRAKHCQFPHLESVKSAVSLDAIGAELPKLKKVNGNLNINAKRIQLPELKTVLGGLEVLHPITIPQLETITGKLTLKSDAVEIPKFNRNSHNEWIEIHNQKDANRLDKEVYQNVLIHKKGRSLFNKSLRINTELFYGHLKVINTNCQFPHLNRVCGHFEISNDTDNTVKTPNLEEVSGNCVIEASHQNIHVKAVKKMLYIKKGLHNTFPNLETIGKLNISREGSELLAPQLKDIKKQSIFLGKLHAPNLEVLNINYDYHFNDKLPNLKVINGDVRYPRRPYNYGNQTFDPHTIFEELKIINGNLTTNSKLKTPKLEHIYGAINVDDKAVVIPNLKSASEILGDKAQREYFVNHGLPNVERIHRLAYQTMDRPEIVQEFFHDIRPSQRLSKKGLYIFTRWNDRSELISLSEFTKILKMRHNGFQNFYSREVEREWECSMNPHLKSIIKSIKKQWESIVPYSYKDLFQIKSPLIRRFSFNYVGVSEMMQALKAQRVATAGIEVNYYQYEQNGVKTRVKKHNVFETYVADFNKIEDLRTWRSSKQLAYAVKCWCTSTNEAHWLWIEAQYKDEPLAAIASTFRIHEYVIPHIKCLKRQGDVLICEMKKQVIPEGEVVPLTAEQYFSLLVAES